MIRGQKKCSMSLGKIEQVQVFKVEVRHSRFPGTGRFRVPENVPEIFREFPGIKNLVSQNLNSVYLYTYEHSSKSVGIDSESTLFFLIFFNRLESTWEKNFAQLFI
jgi:hypothetical protein